jgi:hypothetical protein
MADGCCQSAPSALLLPERTEAELRQTLALAFSLLSSREGEGEGREVVVDW